MGFEGKWSDVTGKVIGAFFKVYNELGYGFNEKVYENAMVVEMEKMGLWVEQQVPIRVFYAEQVVGEYVADLIVNDVVIVELKAVEELCEEHEAQLLNYLKATEMEVGLLLNFGPEAQYMRKVFDNERKGSMTWIKKENGTKEVINGTRISRRDTVKRKN